MVTVGMHYVVMPGKEAVFEGEFERVIELLRTLPGHVETRLYREVKRPNAYLIYSEWERREDFARFARSPEFAAAREWGRAGILAEPPRHQIFP